MKNSSKPRRGEEEWKEREGETEDVEGEEEDATMEDCEDKVVATGRIYCLFVVKRENDLDDVWNAGMHVHGVEDAAAEEAAAASRLPWPFNMRRLTTPRSMARGRWMIGREECLLGDGKNEAINAPRRLRPNIQCCKSPG